MNNIFIGKHGPLLIAEIGGNHEGNFEYAKKLTRLAIKTDADLIKFQICEADKLISSKESPDRQKHFKKFQLNKKQYLYLASMVKKAGIGYMASIWNYAALSWIDAKMSIYKVASGDLTAYPLLKKIAEKEKPIILSTGLSSEKEVLDAVSYIQSINSNYKKKEMLGLLQCTSMYPTTNKDTHLNVMNRLRELTKVTVGYSDHTEGSEALKYAAAMGAEILEFHFTDNRKRKRFRDHELSLTLEEVQSLIKEIKNIKDYQGDNIKKPLKIELDSGHNISFRRAVYPSKDIKKGEILTEDNLTVLRPNHGIDARNYDKLIGKRLKESVKKHQKLSWDKIL